MNCRSCGEAVRRGQRFCESCGVQVDRACPGCGASVAPEARFCGACGTRLLDGAEARVAAKPAINPARAPVPGDGERRQLTVLFADIVGSTALSGRLDPEALRDVLRNYQRTCADCIGRYGGKISQYLGDGVLAYFGYPEAHDNDAERAVLAGLAIVAEVRRDGVEARVGIHTGLVVVGAVGADEDRVDLAVGETPNLAARVQGEAVPSSVCISAATMNLVGRRFELQSLGARALKGIATPIGLFSVQGAVETHADRDASPLVGREPELAQLLERWALARHGQGQAVFVSGQGGIGKSRLLDAFHERSNAQLGVWHRMHCSPFTQNTALHPVIDLLARAMQAAADGATPDRALALRKLLHAVDLTDDTTHALIGSLLGIGAEGLLPLGDLAPAQRRLRTLDAIIAWLHAEARKQPLVLAVEDLHWIDASTRDLFGMLLERIGEVPMLMVFTFRPEFVPPWTSREQIGSIALARLGADEVASLAQAAAAGKELPPALLGEIVRRTDGVPLFIEELTKAILGSGLVVERDGVLQLASGTVAQLDIPATLRDSLTARLDQLGAAKSVAQIASVLGREFDYALLHAVIDMPQAELDPRLAALNRAGIIQQSGVPPRSQYVFKHALIQEAAYETLLKSARQRHHQRAAQAYVERFADVAQSRPELVAHHYSRAHMPEAALPLWQRAGELAVARSGYEEAIAHLNEALAQLALMPPSDARAVLELSLRVRIGPALMARLGMGAAETGANYARACELAESMGEPTERFTAMWGDWLFKNAKGQLAAAAKRSEDLVVLGRSFEDDGYSLQAHHSRWTNFLFLGDIADVRADTQEGIRLYDRIRHRHHKHLYGGHDPGVCAHNFGAAAACAAGHGALARQLMADSLALARELDHSFSITSAYLFAPVVMHGLGDRSAAGEFSELLLEKCGQQGFVQWRSIGQVSSGASQVFAGQTQAGLRLIETGLQSQLSHGTVGFTPPVLLMAAQAHLEIGDRGRALDLLATAVELSNTMGVAWQLPDVLCLQAQTRLAAGQINVDEALIGFGAAARRAKAQGAAAAEWRAVTAIARLLAAQGKVDQARGELKRICGEAQGDAAALTEAKELLASLGG